MPSAWDDMVVFRTDALTVFDIGTGNSWVLDPEGTLPFAGPTFFAYYRSVSDGFEVLALGYEWRKEQVLAVRGLPCWFSPCIAVSRTHVALATEDFRARLFRWQGASGVSHTRRHDSTCLCIGRGIH